jgi:hypothetical protein
MSISKPSIWHNRLTTVEEMIGKAEIIRGKQILKQENMQAEIDVSPIDFELNRKKIALLMDGGWD